MSVKCKLCNSFGCGDTATRFNVMFKARATVFYRDFTQPSGFRPDKTRAASFLNGFKNIRGKACTKRVHNNDAFVNVGN